MLNTDNEILLNIVLRLVEIFKFNERFLLSHYNEIRDNYKVILFLLKVCKYLSDDDKKHFKESIKTFINSILIKKTQYVIISDINELTHLFFMLSESFFKIDYYSDFINFNNHNYVKILKNYERDNVLLINLKTHCIDKNKRFLIISNELYDELINIPLSYNEIYERVLIKGFKLKKPYKRGSFYFISDLKREFESYNNKVKINLNEFYYSDYNSDFNSDNYIKSLIDEYYNYYSHNNEFNEFIEFIQYYKKLNIIDDERESIQTNERDYYSLVCYIQTINYIESIKVYNTFDKLSKDKTLFYLNELKDKNLKYDINMIEILLKREFFNSNKHLKNIRELLKL